jgi:hypothetical protein
MPVLVDERNLGYFVNAIGLFSNNHYLSLLDSLAPFAGYATIQHSYALKTIVRKTVARFFAHKIRQASTVAHRQNRR